MSRPSQTRIASAAERDDDRRPADPAATVRPIALSGSGVGGGSRGSLLAVMTTESTVRAANAPRTPPVDILVLSRPSGAGYPSAQRCPTNRFAGQRESGGCPAVPDDQVTCPQCGQPVPDTPFCVRCGELLRGPGGPAGRGRPGSYAAAPGQSVARVAMFSTLLPQLPDADLDAFRLAFAGGLIALIALVVVGAFPVALVGAAVLVPASSSSTSTRSTSTRTRRCRSSP